MPAPLYYLPKQPRNVTPADLDRLGLGYAFTPGKITVNEVRGGPDGGEGIIVADADGVAAHQVGYYRDRQEWMEFGPALLGPRPLTPDPRPPADGWPWVGRYTDAPVLPEQLARPQHLRGHLVQLDDGQEWLIPVARAWTEEDGDLRWFAALPQRITLDSEGHWKPSWVVKRYAALWDLAIRWHESQQAAAAEAAPGQTSLLVDFDGFVDAAVAALATNYRVGRAEVVLLGLLTVETARAILDALVDRPTLLKWLAKKNAMTAAGSSIAAGPAAATAATDPASPT